jgi:hypothetical protein
VTTQVSEAAILTALVWMSDPSFWGSRYGGGVKPVQRQVIESEGLTYVRRKCYSADRRLRSMLMTRVSPGRTGEPGRQGGKHHQSFEPTTHRVELHPQAFILYYRFDCPPTSLRLQS